MKLQIGITVSRSFVLYICVLFISLIPSVDGAQFFNITCSFLSSVSLAAASAPAPAIVKDILTSMCISL